MHAKTILALIAGSAIWSAYADETPSGPVQRVVVTASHYINGVGTSDAASQGTIVGYLLDDIPLLRPGEIMENVPGLVVTQHSGDGKANQYFLRGYNLDHGTDFATFVDGLPVNMPTNAHGQGYSDLNFLIPELVQKIDYQKGPYFANTGDFSSAGSAHVQYKDHLEDNILNMTVGSHDYQRLLLAGSHALSADADGPRLMTALEGLQTNGPWTTPEHLHKLNGLFKLTDGNDQNGWSVTGGAYTAHWTSTDQVPLSLIDSGQIGRFDSLNPSDGGKTTRDFLTSEWHFHDAEGYSKAMLYGEHYNLRLWSDFTFFEQHPDQGDQFEQFEQRNVIGGEILHGWHQHWFGLPSTTEIGTQIRHDDIGIGLLNTADRIPYATVSDDGVSETTTGTYLQNTLTWNSWLRSLIGVRLDTIDVNVNAKATPVNSGSQTDRKVSPKLSLIFGPWYKTEIFLNYGKGFHSNDARGVTAQIDPNSGEHIDPVPALVGSVGEEIGIRTQVIKGLQSSLALWRLNSDSELVYNADDGTLSPNGASRRYGLEWNNHMIVNQWLLLDADMAWTHARFADDNANGDIGNHIPNAVGQVALLRATLRHIGPWSASWETRFIGSYPLSQDNALKAPSATVSNIIIKRDLSPQIQLSVEGLNLFNKRFYDIAYEQDYRLTPSAPIIPNGITVHPGEPRQIRIGLQLRF